MTKGGDDRVRVRAYKAFDSDFCCRGFQYEVGKTYYHDGDVEPCVAGFHACKNPAHVIKHYPLIGSRFGEVEVLDPVYDRDKLVSGEITVIKELSFEQWVKSVIMHAGEELADSVFNKHYGRISDISQGKVIFSRGDGTRICTMGSESKVAAIGKNLGVSISGSSSTLRTQGNGANICVSGAFIQACVRGEACNVSMRGGGNSLWIEGGDGRISSFGDHSGIEVSGDGSRISSCGHNAGIKVGRESLVCAIGRDSIVSAGEGSLITLAAYGAGEPVTRSSKVGGKGGLKPDVYYVLGECGEFVEVEVEDDD